MRTESPMHHPVPTPKPSRSPVAEPVEQQETESCESPLLEIMVEQLRYLTAHSKQSCAPECEECARLQQVQNWLLAPFGSRVFRTMAY